MKFNVGMKLAMAFGLALAILVTVGAVTYQSTNQLMATASSVADTHEVIQALQDVLSSAKDAELGQRGYLLTGEEKYLEPYTRGRELMADRIAAVRALTKDNANHQRRLDTLDALINGREGKFAELQETIDARKDPARGAEAAVAIVRSDKGKQIMEDIRKTIRDMRDEAEALLKVRSAEADASSRNAVSTILYGTLGAFAIMAIVGFFITRDIANPLKEISANAERIANGDLNITIAKTDRSDEVGALLLAFSRMTDSLRTMATVATKIAAGDLRVKVQAQSERDVLGTAFSSMILGLQQMTGDVLEGINVLGTAANEISASTSQMAASASESATAVTETTTTVEEVRQTAQMSSQKARMVLESSQMAAQISLNGRKSVEDAVAGVGRTRQQMESIAASMMRLSEQGHAVGQIIATVEDLSAQSTLLAVNAAIEATRAGEHGKSFGVVAQEVKSLAEQSRQATNQVRTILIEIQKATAAAVMATEQGSKAVEAGGKQTEIAGESIQSLAGSINDAAQAATQIAASSQQQLVGMDQVVLAMENIRQASTQNVASAKQLENAAQNLTGLGQRLKQMVERYKM